MADPLSIIASVIALGQAARAAEKALGKVKSFLGASAELDGLHNEIASIGLITTGIGEEIRLRSSSPEYKQSIIDNLSSLLDKAKEELLELQKLVHFQLISSHDDEGQAKANRTSWVRKKRKVQAFRERLNTMRLDLIAQLGVVAVSELTRFRLSIEEVVLIVGRGISAQTLFQDRAIRLFEEHSRKLDGLFDTFAVRDGGNPSTGSDSPSLEEPTAAETHGSEAGAVTGSTNSTLRVSVTHSLTSGCRDRCTCACHIIRRWKTPSLLSRVMGTIVVGYTSLRVTSAQCDNGSCLRNSGSSAKFTFYLPSWACSRILQFKLGHSPANGPHLLLRLPKIIPSRSDIFHYAETGNVKGIQDLFRRRKASVHDTAESGSTVLHFALNASKYKVCKLLLDSGADPEIEGPQDRKPIDIAWDSILAKYVTGDIARDLSTMFRSDDHIESRNFCILHKSTLGLLPLDLEELLQDSVFEINNADADGRSCLVWASIRGDGTAVALLLRRGADPNKADRSGKTPLHHARNAACTNLLLAYNPNVDRRDVYGRTALHIACRRGKGDKDRVSALLKAGADPNAIDKWQRTPLSYLAQYDGAETATVLIKNSATAVSLACADVDGFTPILTAIESNSHQMLLLLLGLVKVADLRRRTFKKAGILHVALRSGDAETLAMLERHAAVNFGRAELYRADEAGYTVLDIRDQRVSMSVVEVVATDKFLAAIQGPGEDTVEARRFTEESRPGVTTAEPRHRDEPLGPEDETASVSSDEFYDAPD